MPPTTIRTGCCIAGGGPAGMMVGFLLARAGVSVTVLEKHADFLRDFRGDTVHPSTLEVLEECGLLPEFKQLPQHKVQELSAQVGGCRQRIVDFRGLKPFDYLSLVPQWDFLDMLAAAGRRYPHFDLRMRHEVNGLVETQGRIVGVRAHGPDGEIEVRGDVIIACDGRESRVRKSAGLRIKEFGAPIDVLWFRLRRKEGEEHETFGIFGAGHVLILLNRNDYWQTAYVVPKGSDAELREQPVDAFRDSIARIAPFLADHVEELRSWNDVKTLEVRVDRLERWYRDGLLFIGDAAHAMSPIGGVGINLAIQDAVAAANALAPGLALEKPVDTRILQQVESRRLLPTKIIQALQVEAQERIISKALERSGDPPRIPALVRGLLRFRAVRNIPARIIAYGFRREHVRTVVY